MKKNLALRCHGDFGIFDDNTAMEKPEGEVAEDDLTNDLGRALCSVREDVRVKRRG